MLKSDLGTLNLAYNILDSIEIGDQLASDLFFGGEELREITPTQVIDLLKSQGLFDFLEVIGCKNDFSVRKTLRYIYEFYRRFYRGLKETEGIIDQINKNSSGKPLNDVVGKNSTNHFIKCIADLNKIGNYDINKISYADAYYIIYREVLKQEQQRKEMKKS